MLSKLKFNQSDVKSGHWNMTDGVVDHVTEDSAISLAIRHKDESIREPIMICPVDSGGTHSFQGSSLTICPVLAAFL